MFKQAKHVENIFSECYFDNLYCGALEKKLTKKNVIKSLEKYKTQGINT